MHRSGTTMITQLLENLGLFVGTEKEVNHEALFFWEINNWIFDLHTATPEKPHNMRYKNMACEKVIIESLEYFVQSSKRKQYLGSLTSTFNSIKDVAIPFGWKDPKNTFTIDFWKHVFPNPKIIHIYRNPIDSVSSYIERDLVLKNKFVWNWKKKIKRNFLISKHFHENFRLTSIEEGYHLWEEYITKALSLKQEFPDYLEIKYEDFLAQPEPYIHQLISFCGLKMDEEKIKNELNKIDGTKAYSFIKNAQYVEIYHQLKNQPIVQQLGYDAII